MDSQSIDTINADKSEEQKEATCLKRRLVLQLKLGYILHKWHLNEHRYDKVDPTMAFMDFVNLYAKKYAEEYETAKEFIAEVCNNVCEGSCLKNRYGISQLRAAPELLDKCPFDLNLLHTLLHDGYPVESDAYNVFREITGHELMTVHPSAGK